MVARIIVQHVRVQWTKASRGHPGSVRRNAVARAFELPTDVVGASQSSVSTALPGGARVSFARVLSEELAIVPALRVVGAWVFALALLVALSVGAWFAARLARPVGSLGEAAGALRSALESS